MDLPLLYGTIVADGISTGSATYDGKRLMIDDPVPVSSVDSLKPRKSRGTVILADAESLSSGRFAPRFVERCRIPGNDVWLIESIYDESDILDAFLPGLAKLVIPVHTVVDDSVLKTAVEISDDCIPLIVCEGGRALGRERDIIARVKKLCSTGFGTVMIADIDGSMKKDVWHIISDCCRTIPYCPCSEYPGTEDRAVDLFPFRPSVSRRRIPPHGSRSP